MPFGIHTPVFCLAGATFAVAVPVPLVFAGWNPGLLYSASLAALNFFIFPFKICSSCSFLFACRTFELYSAWKPDTFSSRTCFLCAILLASIDLSDTICAFNKPFDFSSSVLSLLSLTFNSPILVTILDLLVWLVSSPLILSRALSFCF